MFTLAAAGVQPMMPQLQDIGLAYEPGSPPYVHLGYASANSGINISPIGKMTPAYVRGHPFTAFTFSNAESGTSNPNRVMVSLRAASLPQGLFTFLRYREMNNVTLATRWRQLATSSATLVQSNGNTVWRWNNVIELNWSLFASPIIFE